MVLLYTGGLAEAQSTRALLTRAIDYEFRGEIDSARQEALSLLNEYDSNWFDISKYLIRLNSEAGLFTENIQLFAEGHRRGYFYFIHPGMPEYKPYLSLPGFDSVSIADLKLREEANRVSRTLFYVQLPENYDPTARYPLVFIFHGGGRSIQSVRDHWQVTELNRNFIKVYLQSYRHFDYNTFGWGTGDPRLDVEIRTIAEKVLSQYPVDTSVILTAGISAGASAAIDLTLRSVIPATGFIAWCPDVPATLLRKPLPDVPDGHIRGYICAGETDHFRPRQKVLIAILDSMGINTKYVIDPGTGHSYPKNENHQINGALKFIYDQETLVDSDFEAKISGAISSGLCRGLSIAVNENGKTLYYNYGRAFSRGTDSPDQNTIYELGSLSKLFTLFIFRRLESEGVVREGANIAHYLSELRSAWARATRIKELITHTSGLPSLPDNLHASSSGNPVEGYSHEDLMLYIRKFKPESSDRSFHYSNTGAALVGFIMEEVTGKSYQNLVDEYIIGPMQADGLYLTLQEEDQSLLADGSKRGADVPHWDITGAFASSSGLRGSAEGIAAFLESYLSDPSLKLTRISMERIIVREAEDGISAATGWFVKEINGKSIYWVAGSTGGFSAFMGFNSKTGKSAALLSNSSINLNEAGWRILE
jgi:CubicO group peptidase (beta-lactamase class C family)